MIDNNLEVKQWKIDDLIGAEYNPRKLSPEQKKTIKDSITRFGLVDPVLVNINKERKGIIIGGHQRTMIARELGFKKMPCIELDLTLEKEKELNVRLNKNTGDFDFDLLSEHFKDSELISWGFDDNELITIDDVEEELEKDVTEIEFSEFLNEKNNYVVLFFDNEMDWLQAQTHFKLKTVASKRQNGKKWSEGIGRVIKGNEYLKDILS